MLSGHGGLGQEVADAVWMVTVGGPAERVGYPMDHVVESYPRLVLWSQQIESRHVPHFRNHLGNSPHWHGPGVGCGS